MTTILERGVRSSIQPTNGPNLAYTTLAVITTNDESVLPRRFDYNVNPNSIVLPFPTPALFDSEGVELSRRSLPQSYLSLAYTTLAVFGSNGIPAPRIALPLADESDDCQIIVRGGAFVMNFTADLRRGLPPHGVQFTNLSQTPVESWTWYFGDGQTSNEKNPYHIYIGDDDFDVTLQCGSAVFGSARITKYDYIIVGVRLLINPTEGEAPLRVSFNLDERQLGD